jgi:hypothetical protein
MAATQDGKAKGVGFVGVRAFVLERFGEDGWNATLERLTPADRDALVGLVPVGWYSLALYARLIRAVDDALGCGDLAMVVQLGRFEAERDLTTIHRFLLRLANPGFAVEKLATTWRQFHDSGVWSITRPNGHQVMGTLDGWAHVDYALCRELVGYFARCLELVGATHVMVEHPQCRARGDSICRFQARWGAARDWKEPPRSGEGDVRREPTVSGAHPITPRDAFAASVDALPEGSPRARTR